MKLWFLKTPAGRLVRETVGTTRTETVRKAFHYVASLRRGQWMLDLCDEPNRVILRALARRGWGVVPVSVGKVLPPPAPGSAWASWSKEKLARELR